MIWLLAAWRNTSVRPGPARDHVGGHLAGTNGGQLVDIPDHQQGRRVRHRLQQRMHQQHIDHGCFVDDEQVAVERVSGYHAETRRSWDGIDFEQAVDGLALEAGGLVHALGRAARGSTQQEPCPLCRERRMGVDEGCLPTPGPPVTTSTLEASLVPTKNFKRNVLRNWSITQIYVRSSR